MVLAPVIRGRKGEYVDLFAELQSKGYAGPGSTAWCTR
jgi:excinuclease ABC subunit A